MSALTWKRAVIGTLALVGAAYIGLTIYLNLFSDCYNQRISEVNSPNGKHSATLGQRNCENEPSQLQVWLKTGEGPAQSLIFEAISTTTEPIDMIWAGDTELQIYYPSTLQPTTMVDWDEHVHIAIKPYEK